MKRILRAAAVVGLSSVVVVALGAVRAKVIAVGVGTEGIGTLGILTAAANFGVVIFAVGLNTSGVQAIASAAADPDHLRRVRSALLGAARGLAILGGVTVGGVALGLGAWGSDSFSVVVAVSLGVTVAAMIVSGSQLAFINGLGRVRILALCNALGAVLGTAGTLLALLVSPEVALVTALVGTPLATLLGSAVFVWRERKGTPRVGFRDWLPEARGLLALGGMVMLGTAITAAVQLAARLLIEQRFGLSQVGYFQAAWTITTVYMGFVLTALAAEYFPRISEQSSNRERVNGSVDAQVRVALLLATPVLVWTIWLAPIALTVLYSQDFQAGASLLRWQLVGDVLKVIAWAIAFLLLARRARFRFFLAEVVFNVAYLGFIWWAVERSSLNGFGLAYAGAYAVYLVAVLIAARTESGFRLRAGTAVLGSVAFTAALAVCLGAESSIDFLRAAGAGLAGIVTLLAIGMLVVMRRWEASEVPGDDPAIQPTGRSHDAG